MRRPTVSFLANLREKHFPLTLLTIVLLLNSFIAPAASAQQKNYDEISVVLNVPRIGSIELPAIIINQEIYLPVKDLFDYLKIKNSAPADFTSITGYINHPASSFRIDQEKNNIVYNDKTFEIQSTDFIKTETNLYMKSSLFGQIFGLECIFNFRNLSVTLNTKNELPAIREMQQELMRKNISQLKGEKKADTTIKRSFSLFHIGSADWSVSAIQSNGLNTTRASLHLGANIAGGEADANLNYITGRPFWLNQQFYRWRYVNNEIAALRQVTAGRIFTQSTSSVFAPVTGVQITNTPTTHRRSFGTYRLSSTTEPDWMVELYVNNILVNYVKADASGFFTFDVPIVYGNSAIKLRFYGPWGEEITKEQNIAIPFTFLPSRQLEYVLSAGVVSDDEKSRFSRAQFNYGLNRSITIGTGVEYLSSVNAGKAMPFLNASLRLGPGMLISAEHTQHVRTKTTFNYRLPSNILLDVFYIKYAKGQTAIKFNYLEEKRASLSLPLRGKNFSGFSRIIFSHYKMPKANFSSTEFLLSASFRKLTSNFTTTGNFITSGDPQINSALSVTYRFPSRIRVTPQVQYDYMQQGVRLFKAEVEKGFSKSNFFNISYEKDILNNISTASAGLRINFSFAQTAVSAMRTNKAVTLIQSATGSLIYDGKTNYTNARNRSSVGRGGIVLIPFLDVNCNGKRDADEPKVPGLKARTNGGFIVSKNDESLIRIVDLEPYTPYLVELDDQKLGNIAWQIKNKTLKIAVDPNQMKLVEIPVAVLGEASGMVYINKGKEQPGIGRIIVAFFDSSSRLVAKTLSEGDGYFSYLGLPPGNYTARIDSAQLQVLNMRVTPEKLSFHIATSNDGVVADGFAFMLQSLTPSKLPIDTGEKQQQQAAIQQETSVNSKNEYAEQERSSEKQLHSIIKGKQSSDQKQSDIRLQSNKLPVSEKKPQIADLEKQSTQPGVSGQVKSQNNEQSIIINSKPVTNKKQQQHLTPDAQKAVDVNKGQMQMKEKEIPISNSLQQLFQRLEQMISEMQESAQKLQKFFMEEEVKKQDED